MAARLDIPRVTSSLWTVKTGGLELFYFGDGKISSGASEKIGFFLLDQKFDVFIMCIYDMCRIAFCSLQGKPILENWPYKQALYDRGCRCYASVPEGARIWSATLCADMND